jgi:hypothetical protein
VLVDAGEARDTADLRVVCRLDTPRLLLEPLRADHADEMATVPADPQLYAFTGGEPPGVDTLRRRYTVQATGRSVDGTRVWLKCSRTSPG